MIVLKWIMIAIAVAIVALIVIGMLYMGKWSDEAMDRIMEMEEEKRRGGDGENRRLGDGENQITNFK